MYGGKYSDVRKDGIETDIRQGWTYLNVYTIREGK